MIGRKIFDIANPAVATDWELQLPSTSDWRFLAGEAKLNTSATAGSRFVGFRMMGPEHDLGRMLLGIPSGVAFSTVSSTVFAHYIRSASEATILQTGASILLPVNDIVLPAGSYIGSETQFQAGDNYTNIRVWLEAVEPLPLLP